MSEYNCTVCDFSSESFRGTSIHVGQKHDDVTFPKDETYLTAIRSLAEELDQVPSFKQMEELGEFSGVTYHNRFGSWSNAVIEAGFQPRSTPTGRDSPHWRGGGTKFYKTKAGLAWRRAVFQRDEYTCQDCGDDTGGNLNAHHIKRRDQYPGLELMVWNGVTLCRYCHAERHTGEDVYEMMKEKAKRLSTSSA